MINFDDVTKENIKEHNPNWPQIPYHPYRILKIGGSGSGKTNSLFNLINHQTDIDKMYLCAKDPYEAKYQFFSEKRESTSLKKMILKLLLNTQMILLMFTKILKNTIQIIPDMLSNGKLNPIVTELLIRG